MIGYVMVGTNDLDRAAKFYDELLAVIGVGRSMEFDTAIVWSSGPSAPSLSVTKPYDGQPATVGNGVMLALLVDSPDKVDAVHAKALELGGADEGAVGVRGEGGFYCGYFRDLDGNKFNVFCAG
ncbi:MAG: VOC family protein [Gammaproteobacteria bacterium]